MSNNPVIKIEPRDDNTYSSILENVFGQRPTAGHRDEHIQEYDEVLIKAERLERMDISDIPAKRMSKLRKLTGPFDADIVMDTIEEEEDAVEEAFAAAKEFASAGEKMRYTPFAHSTIVPVRTRARKSQKVAKSENPTLDREEERLRIDGEQRLKRPDKNLTTYKGKYLRMGFATRIAPGRNTTPKPQPGVYMPQAPRARVTTQKKNESPMDFRRRQIAAEKKASARLDKVQSTKTSKPRVEKPRASKMTTSRAARNTNEHYVNRAVESGSANGTEQGPMLHSQRWSTRLVDRSKGGVVTASCSKEDDVSHKMHAATCEGIREEDDSDGGLFLEE